MDRGCGGWVVDYDAAQEHRAALLSLFADGLNVTLDPPSQADIEKKQKLQAFLKAEGFTSPFAGITHRWFAETEMARAVDAMFTFSNSDWMLTARHLAKDWPYKTIADLKRKMDDDPWLWAEDSRHIVLAHDQPEIEKVTIETIRYLLDKGFKFIPAERG
jgi:hypothetical protein